MLIFLLQYVTNQDRLWRKILQQETLLHAIFHNIGFPLPLLHAMTFTAFHSYPKNLCSFFYAWSSTLNCNHMEKYVVSSLICTPVISCWYIYEDSFTGYLFFVLKVDFYISYHFRIVYHKYLIKPTGAYLSENDLGRGTYWRGFIEKKVLTQVFTVFLCMLVKVTLLWMQS